MHHGTMLHLVDAQVAADWLDYNGHMNDAAYAIVFSRSVDALMDRIGIDAATRKSERRTLFTAQTMLHYFSEAGEGDSLTISCHLLEHDDKRLRVWLDMTGGPQGERLAASEQLLLSIDQSGSNARVAPWLPQTRAALDALAKAQSGLAPAAQAGLGITLKRG
jgi:acyl-CoA thioester hydrolase